MSSDKSQSKAHFDLQSLGENKTDYRAKNNIFHRWKLHTFVYIYMALKFVNIYCTYASPLHNLQI